MRIRPLNILVEVSTSAPPREVWGHGPPGISRPYVKFGIIKSLETLTIRVQARIYVSAAAVQWILVSDLTS